MHPEDTIPNPVPFTEARGWGIHPTHQPTPVKDVARIRRTARVWQVSLVVALSAVGCLSVLVVMVGLAGGVR